MPLGVEVGFSPFDFVFDGYPANSRKKGTPTPPNFWLMSIVAKRMDEDATWYGSRPRQRPHCIRRGPRCPQKGHSSPPPSFRPCLLWPRSPISGSQLQLSSCDKYYYYFHLMAIFTGEPGSASSLSGLPASVPEENLWD